MADETESRRDEELSGNRDRQEYTPRKARHDGGDFKQTMLRDDIIIHMRHEMLVCSADDFLEHLAPFRPSEAWIERAFEHFEQKGLLRTPAKKTSIPTVPNGRKTKNSARAGAGATPEARAAEPDVTTKDANPREWEAYPKKGPQSMLETEEQVFGPLESIVNELLECPDPESGQMSNGYCYLGCPNNEMRSEITGASFKVDAVIRNKAIYKEDNINLAAAQTAVPIEFKKKADPATVFENRKQLVSAANHIMNDDPRRKWMYGITIENTNMSLWYFSHSYSMKSKPFNFTTDLAKFIRIFLSFLYATEEQLGYDTTIHRMKYNGDWCCVFELKVADAKYYYRTVKSLHYPRSLCITGRKSRVWKVVEVSSLEDLEQKPNTSEVALKDCWIDADAMTEKKIQQLIFQRLATVEEATYAWAPTELRDKLKSALKCPEMYFMKIILDCTLGTNKPNPRCCPDPTLLAPPVDQYLADKGKAIPSTQTPPSSRYSSSHSSHLLPPPGTSVHKPKPRHYKVKEHYRVIYAEVGQSLGDAERLSDAIRAFEDTFIALTLMFLAGWVHRDISEGNIILLRSNDGVRAKLSDLEYARCFGDKTVGTDPKTGTPYFMPLEIHKDSFLYDQLELKGETVILPGALRRGKRPSMPASPPLKYIFVHDLESLWWIMVWIIVFRIKNGSWDFRLIFAVLDFPSTAREHVFRMQNEPLYHHLTDLTKNSPIYDSWAPAFLAYYNFLLRRFYANGNREDAIGTDYQNIYAEVWVQLQEFVQEMSNVEMELEDPHSRNPPRPDPLPAALEIRKRARSVGVLDTSAEGSSKKKPKPDEDVFIENESIEDDTTEDHSEDDPAEDDPAEDYTVEDDSGEDYAPEDDSVEESTD